MATNLHEYFLLDEADQKDGPFAHDYPNDRGWLCGDCARANATVVSTNYITPRQSGCKPVSLGTNSSPRCRECVAEWNGEE